MREHKCAMHLLFSQFFCCLHRLWKTPQVERRVAISCLQIKLGPFFFSAYVHFEFVWIFLVTYETPKLQLLYTNCVNAQKNYQIFEISAQLFPLESRKKGMILKDSRRKRTKNVHKVFN